MYQSELEPSTEFPGDYRYAKATILHNSFADELDKLAQRLTELEPPHADELLLRRAVAELVAELPIYRTYSKDGTFSAFYLDTLQSAAKQISDRDGQPANERETLAFILRIMSSGGNGLQPRSGEIIYSSLPAVNCSRNGASHTEVVPVCAWSDCP